MLIVFCGATIWNEGKVTINNGVCLPSMRLNVQIDNQIAYACHRCGSMSKLMIRLRMLAIDATKCVVIEIAHFPNYGSARGRKTATAFL